MGVGVAKQNSGHVSETGELDVVVVGAGIAGIYAIHRFREQGLSVLGIEGAPDVGGVWYHNAYPGARVDVESVNYCYFFDEKLYRDWTWTERFAAQPEILSYLNHVADVYNVRPDITFNTWVTEALWDTVAGRYRITTDTGDVRWARFLVTATGQLSKTRPPNFPGLADFGGEVYETSRWPHHEVSYEGKRVGIIGTGSSGVQATTVVSRRAAQTVVFQRTPQYAIPANNRPAETYRSNRLKGKFGAVKDELYGSGAGILLPPVAGKAGDFTVEEQQMLLEQRWSYGGQSFLGLFADTGVDMDTNTMVADFVRTKIRDIVTDQEVADKLVPTHPIGVTRPCFDTGYYQSFNQDNVTLVDVREDPIARVTGAGIATRGTVHELDMIILALGFNSFTGALDGVNIRNEEGRTPSDNWTRGPRTYLGLMTTGFPNHFNITGPGSPTVLSNFFVANVFQIDFLGDLFAHMDERGYRRVEPTSEAQDEWTRHSAEIAEPLIRRVVDNYMTHKNDDGSRVFIPYAGGLNRYIDKCNQVAAQEYTGLAFK
jgi:cation diffusion facilitator CzcD-associated flavoprotein CzcO